MLTAMLAAIVLGAPAGPIKVEVVQNGGRWELLRGGKPYFVKGVGGTLNMDALIEAGGNSMRTWGVGENTQKELDEAHRRGLTVAVGIWLGHRSYFDYTKPEDLERQRREVRAAVEKYKNHPAVLVWGLGNEMEVDNNDTPALWKEIEVLAQMVKSIDPNHPVMTVVAEVSREKIQRIQKYAPSIDILGINSYGGMNSLSERLRDFGWTKPFLITEFGPLGPWERPRTDFGAALEQTSTEKAAFYRQAYERVVTANPGWALGSYAFLWGEKQEVTPTWFGMWLKTGERTEAVDVMTRLWSGREPKNRAPQVQRLSSTASGGTVAPGTQIAAEVDAKDPDGNPLKVRWVLKFEVGQERYAGEGEKRPDQIEGVLPDSEALSIRFRAPREPGNYRLYAFVLDGKGAAGTANFPFRVP